MFGKLRRLKNQWMSPGGSIFESGRKMSQRNAQFGSLVCLSDEYTGLKGLVRMSGLSEVVLFGMFLITRVGVARVGFISERNDRFCFLVGLSDEVNGVKGSRVLMWVCLKLWFCLKCWVLLDTLNHQLC